MNLEPHAYTDAEIRRINEEDEHYYKLMQRFNHYCHRCEVKRRARWVIYLTMLPGGWWAIVSIFT